MNMIWIFQIALDIAVVVILVRYFVFRKYSFLGMRDLLKKEVSARDRINTPLGSPLSTLSEKRNASSSENKSHSRASTELDTTSALFGGSTNLKVNDAKRLLNQGLSAHEVARKTGLSQAEVTLLEKMMLGGSKDLS
jgi:hypothetical protein